MSGSESALGEALREIAALTEHLEEIGVDVDEVDQVITGASQDSEYVRAEFLVTFDLDAISSTAAADGGAAPSRRRKISGVPSALLPDGEEPASGAEEDEEGTDENVEHDLGGDQGTDEGHEDGLEDGEEYHVEPGDIGDNEEPDEDDPAPFDRDEDGYLDHHDEDHLQWAYDYHPTMSAAAGEFPVSYGAVYNRFTQEGIHETGAGSSGSDDDEEEQSNEQSDEASSPSPEPKPADDSEDVADHDEPASLDFSDLALPDHVSPSDLSEAVDEFDTLEEFGNHLEVPTSKLRVWLVRTGTYSNLNSPESRPSKRRIAEMEHEYREPTPYEIIDDSSLPARVDLPNILKTAGEIGDGGRIAEVARKIDVDGNTVADVCWRLGLKQQGKDLLVDGDELNERIETLRQEVA